MLAKASQMLPCDTEAQHQQQQQRSPNISYSLPSWYQCHCQKLQGTREIFVHQTFMLLKVPTPMPYYHRETFLINIYHAKARKA